MGSMGVVGSITKAWFTVTWSRSNWDLTKTTFLSLSLSRHSLCLQNPRRSRKTNHSCIQSVSLTPDYFNAKTEFYHQFDLNSKICKIKMKFLSLSRSHTRTHTRTVSCSFKFLWQCRGEQSERERAVKKVLEDEYKKLGAIWWSLIRSFTHLFIHQSNQLDHLFIHAWSLLLSGINMSIYLFIHSLTSNIRNRQMNGHSFLYSVFWIKNKQT